jgi:hypothetical protein
MTSTQALELAHAITQNDPNTIGPLVQLLYAFKDSGHDPEGEIMMDQVIGNLYLQTSHCEEAIKSFVSLAA